MAKKDKNALEIKQIATAVDLLGKITLFGLGSDNRVYAWNSATGQWVENWKRPEPISQPPARAPNSPLPVQ